MNTFEHGGKIFRAAADLGLAVADITDFSANINPLASGAKIAEWATDCWQKVGHYPDVDYTELRQAIADYHGVTAQQVVVDNGATPLIEAVVRALNVRCGRLMAPTFVEYERALRRMAADIDIVAARSDLSVPLDGLLTGAERYDIIFICTPNNPTGQTVPLTQLVAFLEQLPSTTYCMVDESFLPFSSCGEDGSLASILERFSNLIVLRSATKFFGIPGLRIGYALTSNVELQRQLAATLPIWRVNAIAEQVVINALKDVDFHVETRRYIAEQRAYLTEQLSALGFNVYPSDANYLLFKSNDKRDLYHLLYDRAIIIRRCQNYHGLDDGYYRIAVKTASANQKLIAQLAKIKEKTID